MQQKSKILIIRFSSFGDVTQSLSVPSKVKELWPTSIVHFITRKDFSSLFDKHPDVDHLYLFDKNSGIKGLIKLAIYLRAENYTHIYDSHNNLRSNLLCFILRLFKSVNFIQRPIYRWKRFLLFKLRINHFQQPFSGQRDLIQPLRKWGASESLPKTPLILLSKNEIIETLEKIPKLPIDFLCLAPSAAYHLKRWPKQYWVDLIKNLSNHHFVLLGGPEDRFLDDIQKLAPERCTNLAGLLTYRQNAVLIQQSAGLVSNDTGLMHIAEQLGHKCIALMGPAPFGFPSRPSTQILELNLPCRPCSKHGQGPCKNIKFHQCLVDLTPDIVTKRILQWF